MSEAVSHFDTVALQELRLVMGAEFPQLLRAFAADSIMRIESIEQAARAADAEALRQSAHSFKGSSGNMGAGCLSELCRQLEERARNGELDGCAALIRQLHEEYAAVERELDAMLT